MRQQSNQTEFSLSKYLDNFQISPSKSNAMVLGALHLSQPEDLVGCKDVFDQFIDSRKEIVLEANSSAEVKSVAKTALNALFTELFSKIRDYFSSQGINTDKFNLNVKDAQGNLVPNSELGAYFDKMINGDVDIESKTYSELLNAAINIIDFINMVATRANQGGIEEAEKSDIMQKYIINLPIKKQRDLLCIPGTSERFETLANELKQNFVIDNYVASKVLVESFIATHLSDGNQIHSPLFLEILLGMVDEKTAGEKDRFVFGLKKELTSQICWQAIKDYYQGFSDNFIGRIKDQLKDLLDDNGNVFGVRFGDYSGGKRYEECNTKLEKALESLGLAKDCLGVSSFIRIVGEGENQEYEGWKTREEIAQIIIDKLIEKYPALTKIESSKDRLESILKPIKQVSSSAPEYITEPLSSEKQDQALIDLQVIYLLAQPFAYVYNYGLMVDVLYSKIADPKPKTPQEFTEKAQNFLETLKTKIPQDQHFKIENLKTRCAGEETKDNLFIIAIKYKNDDLISACNQQIGIRALFVGAVINAVELIESILNKYSKDQDKLLLLLGRPDANGCTPLHHAVINENSEVIRVILENCGSDNKIPLLKNGDKEDLSPFGLAFENGCLEVINVIIDNLEPNQLRNLLEIVDDDKTILHHAVINKNSEVIKVILENCGSDNKIPLLNINEEEFDTPFILAFKNGCLEVINVIIDNLDPDQLRNLLEIVDHDNRTILYNAAVNKELEVIKVILNKFDDQDKLLLLGLKDDYGYTPLHYAAEKEKEHLEEVIKVILENCGSDENKKFLLTMGDDENITPLHCAIINKNSKAIKAILENCGSDENKKFLLEQEFQEDNSIIENNKTTVRIILDSIMQDQTNPEDELKKLFSLIPKIVFSEDNSKIKIELENFVNTTSHNDGASDTHKALADLVKEYLTTNIAKPGNSPIESSVVNRLKRKLPEHDPLE